MPRDRRTSLLNKPRTRKPANGAVVKAAKFDHRLAANMAALGLPDFETPKECQVRQHQMLLRFMRLSVVGDWQGLDACGRFTCGREGDCLEGCHFATLHRRVETITSGLPILEAHPGPRYAVCIVHPKWEAEPGSLSELNIAAAAQWNFRRLQSLAIPGLLAMGSFEASPNEELDGSFHWAGEIQQIVVGATKEQLRKAFRIEKRYRDMRPNQRIVDVRAFKSLPLKFAYTQKRLVQRRLAYIDRKERQNRNVLPPRDPVWAEFDAWLLGLPKAARTILFGCSRKGAKIFPRGPQK